MSFDPNNLSIPNGSYFALPYTLEDSQLVIISVPWDVTTSYKRGAALAPDAIVVCSGQVDLYDYHFKTAYSKGIATLPMDENIIEQSATLRRDAEKVIAYLEEGNTEFTDSIARKLSRVNAGSQQVNEYVYNKAIEQLRAGKKVGLVGGDHSTPLGLTRALADYYGEFGILHIDAHADLREAYEGFKYSHASIMYNTLAEVKGVKRLVQVAIRDYCQQEAELIASDSRIEAHFDSHLTQRKFNGESWSSICSDIISSLPQKVHISFDIDGLSPDNCPNTGTPVPGGLSYAEAVHLLVELKKSGREVIGFDLTEVAPSKDETNEWDANVGARLLYKLCNIILGE